MGRSANGRDRTCRPNRPGQRLFRSGDIKTLLSRLFAKGAIKAEAEGRRFRYRPAVKREAVAGPAGKLVERLLSRQIPRRWSPSSPSSATSIPRISPSLRNSFGG